MIDVVRGSPVLVKKHRSVGNQAAADYEKGYCINGRQPVPGRQRNDQVAMKRSKRACRGDEAAILLTCECRYATLNITGIFHVNWAHLDSELGRHSLDRLELRGSNGPRPCGILEHRHPL